MTAAIFMLRQGNAPAGDRRLDFAPAGARR